MKKVLLIQPAFFSLIGIYSRYFPYHLTSMGTYLKNAGHDVRVLDGDSYGTNVDLDFSEQEARYRYYLQELKQQKHIYWMALRRELERFNPDVIGITVWTTSIASSIKTAQICKRQCPEALLVAGGPHITLLPEDLNQLKAIDIAVVGEGEQTLLEIVNGTPLDGINGIYYRRPDGFKKTAQRDFTNDLDVFGIPDRSLLINQTKYKAEDYGLILTSRGCPYNCAFCATSIWKHRVRYRSIDAIIDEIELVQNRYGTIYFTIKDDSFIISKSRVSAFCKKLKKRKINVFWECNVNLINVERNLLLEMKDAGCIAVKIGIESGSDKIQKIIHKKLTNQTIKRQWQIVRSVDIHVTCYFMMGVPGETEEDIYQTVNTALELKPDYISYSIYEIFPSTRLHQIGIDDETALESMTMDRYLSVEPHNYFYKNEKRSLKGMRADRFAAMENFFRSSFRKYNRSPWPIIRRIKSRLPLYIRSSAYLIDDLKSFMKWI